MVDRVLTQVGEQLKHVPVINSHVEMGTPGFLINDAATDYDADLIVMGTKREEERPWYMGSVARDTLHHPSKPLLNCTARCPLCQD
jgi:nucleotide-binding universal stress UspA family protein